MVASIITVLLEKYSPGNELNTQTNMKYLRYLAIIVALGFVTLSAEAKLNSIVINLTAVQQSLAGSSPVYKTNITATTTNISASVKYTTTNTVINNARILKMLANSFNTNIPATATLKVDDNTRHVVVAVGTNIVLDVNSVLHLGSSGSGVASGTLSESMKQAPTTTTTIVRYNFTITGIDSLIYDDTGLTTADGTHTNFTIEGYRTARFNLLSTTVNSTSNTTTSGVLTINGAGEGVISGKDAILKGVVVANILPNI